DGFDWAEQRIVPSEVHLDYRPPPFTRPDRAARDQANRSVERAQVVIGETVLVRKDAVQVSRRNVAQVMARAPRFAAWTAMKLHAEVPEERVRLHHREPRQERITERMIVDDIRARAGEITCESHRSLNHEWIVVEACLPPELASFPAWSSRHRRIRQQAG